MEDRKVKIEPNVTNFTRNNSASLNQQPSSSADENTNWAKFASDQIKLVEALHQKFVAEKEKEIEFWKKKVEESKEKNVRLKTKNEKSKDLIRYFINYIEGPNVLILREERKLKEKLLNYFR